MSGADESSSFGRAARRLVLDGPRASWDAERMTLVKRACSGFGLAMLLSACGGDDAAPRPEPTVEILDPSQEHYGKSYGEWAGEWVKYLNRVSPPECVNPAQDATGEHCGLYQDPASDVFLLSGNYGGVSHRDACVVPAGKAIFLPLVNVYGDNAGVPEDMLFPDDVIKEYVESNFDLVAVDSLHLSVDGQVVKGLERGAVRSARYTLDLVAGENIYACQMLDVEGQFDGYVSGYWALLAPLRKGRHTLAFGGFQDAGPQGQDIEIDVTYELTVE
jgi:hypothetical protein